MKAPTDGKGTGYRSSQDYRKLSSEERAWIKAQRAKEEKDASKDSKKRNVGALHSEEEKKDSTKPEEPPEKQVRINTPGNQFGKSAHNDSGEEKKDN